MVEEISKKDRRKAERYLLHYDKLVKDYTWRKYVYTTSEKVINIGGKSGRRISDMTACTAIKNLEFDKKNAEELKWLTAVRVCFAGLGERKKIFIKCRIGAEKSGYKMSTRGRHAWVVCTQQRYIQNTGETISERSVIRWWRKIIDRTCTIKREL